MANDQDQPCNVCGAQPAIKVKLVKIQGMLVMHQLTWSKGYFCQDCGLRKHAEFQSSMLSKGWWSVGGLIGTPMYLMLNNAKAKKLRQLQPPMRAQQYAPQP
jgi:hypothetical protein